MSEKRERMKKANELIRVIAYCGRGFFHHKGLVSKFVIDKHGHIWFVDAGTEKQIYTHYTNGRWRGFSEGGTLRDVVIRLRYFIQTGNPAGNTFGPWPTWYSDGDPWGYANDMQKVYKAAVSLGIVRAPEEKVSAQDPAHAA